MERDLAHRWTRVGDRPVRALLLGRTRPGVPELVVLPGLGALGYLLPALRACGTWTRVHLLDLPGFGSPVTSGLPAGLGDLAATATGWLAAAELPEAVLVGHSTGAQVALSVARRRPEGLAALVLAGATFPPRARRLPGLVRGVLDTLPHEAPGELPAVLPYYLRGLRRMPQLVASCLADRPEERVRGLDVPLVVLRGGDDHLSTAAWAGRLAVAAPQGRVVQVPGAHNAPFTHPQEVSAALREIALRS